MKIVFLDHAVINPGDISWEKLESLDSLKLHKRTKRSEIVKRLEDADAVLTDSAVIDR